MVIEAFGPRLHCGNYYKIIDRIGVEVIEAFGPRLHCGEAAFVAVAEQNPVIEAFGPRLHCGEHGEIIVVCRCGGDRGLRASTSLRPSQATPRRGERAS